MKKFNPEMKVVRFGNEDVIATSGAVVASLTMSGFTAGTNVAGDGVVEFGGTSYDVSSNADDLYAAIRNAGYSPSVHRSGEGTQDLSTVVNAENTGYNFASTWDGTYNWNRTLNAFFRKQ